LSKTLLLGADPINIHRMRGTRKPIPKGLEPLHHIIRPRIRNKRNFRGGSTTGPLIRIIRVASLIAKAASVAIKPDLQHK